MPDVCGSSRCNYGAYCGWLTDRFGRVLVYRSLAIFQLLITFPVWWSFSHGNVPVTIVSLSLALGIGAWGMFGAQGAFLP